MIKLTMPGCRDAASSVVWKKDVSAADGLQSMQARCKLHRLLCFRLHTKHHKYADALLSINCPVGMTPTGNDRCGTGALCWWRAAQYRGFETLLQVDPHDRRHLCLCGGRGALTVLKLLNPARDRCAAACLHQLISFTWLGVTLLNPARDRCAAACMQQLRFFTWPGVAEASKVCGCQLGPLPLMAETRAGLQG